MAITRVTFFFTFERWGWSESLYQSSDNLTQVQALALALGSLRKNLLGDGASLDYVRISDDSIQGDSLILTAPQLGAANPLFGIPAQAPPAGVLIRLLAGAKPRRLLCLRGLPNILKQTPVFGPLEDAKVWARYVIWREKVKADGWGLRKDTLAGATPYVNMGLVDALGTFTAIAHGLVTGAVIKIRNYPLFPYINRYWFVRKITDDQLQLQRFHPNSFLPTSPGTGQWRKVVYAVTPITGTHVERVSSHKTGRPFDSPVGRRRART